MIIEPRRPTRHFSVFQAGLVKDTLTFAIVAGLALGSLIGNLFGWYGVAGCSVIALGVWLRMKPRE